VTSAEAGERLALLIMDKLALAAASCGGCGR
jgi:hypothetical protein